LTGFTLKELSPKRIERGFERAMQFCRYSFSALCGAIFRRCIGHYFFRKTIVVAGKSGKKITGTQNLKDLFDGRASSAASFVADEAAVLLVGPYANGKD
jgi:hypothetical protein